MTIAQLRSAAYARAFTASGGCSNAIAALVRHVVDLALLEHPQIHLHWKGLARSATSVATVIELDAVRSVETYARALSRIGEIRIGRPRDAADLEARIDAWRWARSRAFVWPAACTRAMQGSLTAGVDESSRREIEAVLRDDDLSPAMWHRLEIALISATGRRFQREHGLLECQRQPCLDGRRRFAVAQRGRAPLCAVCELDARISSRARIMRDSCR